MKVVLILIAAYLLLCAVGCWDMRRAAGGGVPHRANTPTDGSTTWDERLG